MRFKTLTPEAVKFLVVHCSATPPTMDIGAKEIDRWHRERGWYCIGYHYVIRRDGSVEKGRADDTPGAHVENYNHCSLGICWVGGIASLKRDSHSGRQGSLYENPEDNRTDAQKATLAALVKQLHNTHPWATVQGHRDFPGVTKACPSFDVKPWWASLPEDQPCEISISPSWR